MKKVFLLLFLVCSASTWMISQNSICQVTVVDQEIGANLIVKFNDGEMINLRTRFKENQIRTIDSYGNNEFVLILIEPISGYNEYMINAAFKLQNGWIQDYQDRSYFKTNTGLTCSQITSITIKDEQTLSVEYETTTSSDEYFKTKTNLILGKHSLFEVSTKLLYSFIIYGNATELKAAIEHSPRQNYSEM
jgi:hypothetical protein